MTDDEKVKQFLSEQQYMVVAVTLDDGTPWAVPVRVKLQWGRAFEWESALETEHSKAIRKRPEIALTLFSKDGDAQLGFYAQAKAELAEEYEPGFGRYRALVTKAWINDETFVKREVELTENE